MKRRILVFTIVVFSMLLIWGCGKADSVESIALKDYSDDAPIEVLYGAFDYEGKTLTVTYSSGESKELPLEETMISDVERLKFYYDGEQTVKIEYGGASANIKINVKRHIFENVYMEDLSVTYDGSEHKVEVLGDIPAGAKIIYPQGNTFVNAGKYDVSAIVSCDGYISKSLSANVSIARAKYDMSGVSFKGATVTYDGQLHELAIEGEIPEGVGKPVYYIGSEEKAGEKDVGVYTVIARFPTNNSNYEAIPSYEAVLTIEQSKYAVEGLEFVFLDKNGKELSGEKIYDGEAVSIKLKDTTILPTDTKIVYSAESSTESLKDVSKQLNLVNAGKYKVTASFVSPDNKNYAPIEDYSVSFEIKRADFDMSAISFISKALTYNGEAASLAIDGKLFPGIEVKYKYLKDGKEVSSEDVKSVGTYEVVASFAHSNNNYNSISDMTASLIIEQCGIGLSGIVSQDSVDVIYTGNAENPFDFDALDGALPDTVEYKTTLQIKTSAGGYNETTEELEDGYEDCESAIKIGEYRIKFEFSPTDAENYVIENGETQYYTFRIWEEVADET